MGRQNCHLHAFSANSVQYGRRSSELDFGGPGGCEGLKRTLQDSADPEHEGLPRRLGLRTTADFDPAHFVLPAINQQPRTLD